MTPFERRVADIDRRVRVLLGAKAAAVALNAGPGDSVTWDRADRRATLVLHRTDRFHRLSLSLHTGSELHPEPLQIGYDDADVVDLIAEPVAALLAEAPP